MESVGVKSFFSLRLDMETWKKSNMGRGSWVSMIAEKSGGWFSRILTFVEDIFAGGNFHAWNHVLGVKCCLLVGIFVHNTKKKKLVKTSSKIGGWAKKKHNGY